MWGPLAILCDVLHLSFTFVRQENSFIARLGQQHMRPGHKWKWSLPILRLRVSAHKKRRCRPATEQVVLLGEGHEAGSPEGSSELHYREVRLCKHKLQRQFFFFFQRIINKEYTPHGCQYLKIQCFILYKMQYLVCYRHIAQGSKYVLSASTQISDNIERPLRTDMPMGNILVAYRR